MTSTLTEEEKLKKVLKTALIEVLEERRDLVREAVEEAIEDIALARAIDEGAQSGEQNDWSFLTQRGLTEAYGSDEPEYSLDLIKEPNLEYDRR
jgi:hypothetical protein